MVYFFLLSAIFIDDITLRLTNLNLGVRTIIPKKRDNKTFTRGTLQFSKSGTSRQNRDFYQNYFYNPFYLFAFQGGIIPLRLNGLAESLS